jgi:serine protease Do
VVLYWGAPVASAEPAPTLPQETLSRVFPSIVRIEAIRLSPIDGHMMKMWTAGSGVVVTAQGHVLTNCHVTENVDIFRCYLFDGQRVDARRVGEDPATDLAVLQLDLGQLAPGSNAVSVAAFGDSGAMKAGDVVYALGSPGFLAQSVTVGIVSNPSLVLPLQTVGKMQIKGEDVGLLVRWILHDAKIFGGNSGGPLVNSRGEVVGINEIGVFNLSGAIPGNLAHGVAGQLIAGGKVMRGWSGLTVQPRLEVDNATVGVLVSDVAAGSPAEKAGLRSGDIVLSCDGTPIADAYEKAVSAFYRLETAHLPGQMLAVEYLRGGARVSATLALAAREPAESDLNEVREWGAVVTDLTTEVARNERLPDTKGVLFQNISPAGPAGQAEPELRQGDVVIAVEGAPVSRVAELTALTKSYFPNGDTTATRPVVASFRRDGAVLSSVVELRNTNPHPVPPTVHKAWLGVTSQPLTPKLNKRLGINSENGGARVTRVYAGSEAAKAGLKVGDVLLALDGMPVVEQRSEDSQVLERQVRQYRAGTTASVTVWRDGKSTDMPVVMEVQPKPTSEMPLWEDEKLEFEVRQISFEDRARLELLDTAAGVLVSSTVPSGWAELGGLRGDDLVLAADGASVPTVDDLHRARDAAAGSGRRWLVLEVLRRGKTVFVEINLKPLQTK